MDRNKAGPLRRLIGFMSCLVILLAGLTLAQCGHNETDEHRRIGEELKRALGHNVRPIEPRLMLDTGWVSCDADLGKSIVGESRSHEKIGQAELTVPRCSSPPQPTSPGFRKVIGLARRFSGSFSQEHAAALPLFIDADEANTRATIAALRSFGRQPDALVDLSAAYLHLAGLTDRPHLLLESLESSSAALQMSPADPHARFNWALGLSKLNLITTAHLAWQSYVETAPSDDWAEEAHGFLARTAGITYKDRWQAKVEPALRKAAHAGDLEGLRALVSRHRQSCREWGERELLKEWAATDGRSDGEALATARIVGDALAKITDDRMLSEQVGAIFKADTRVTTRLRSGHQELAAGLEELYKNWRLDRARDHFQRARTDLSTSPFVLWADFYLSLIAYYQGDYDRALASLKALEARFDRESYPALAGRVLWIEGLIAASTYRLETSAELYQRSLEVFCVLGEEENIAAVHALLAEVLSKLGRYDESWLELYNALAGVNRISDPIRHHAILEVAILNARRQGLYRAGLAFAEEHLHVARRTGSAQILHYAYMHRASLRYALGDLRGAQADLKEASHAAESQEDGSLRERSASDLALVSAEARVDTDPSLAVSLLSQAIRQYEKTRYAYLLPQAYGARARAFLHLGDLSLAERDLARQIQIYEGSADQIQQDIFRLSLLDQAAPAFDQMVELQAMKLGHPTLAWEYCERGRYRAFLDTLRSAPFNPARNDSARPPASLDTAQMQGRLANGEAIIEFSLLDEHLLTWVITRTRIELITQGVRRQDVAQIISNFARDASGKNTPSSSRELHDLLLQPLERFLGGVSHLVIVPDKELFLVPFETLVDRRTGRFLIEDRAVSYSPSTSLYVRLRERATDSRKAEVLAVAADVRGSTRYASLPEAVAEARSVAALYPRGSFLANPGKEQFLDTLSRYQVLHFSGHAVSNAEQPFASKLVLADSPTARAEIYAYELYDRRLPRLELVTLSACGTAEPAKPDLGVAATLAGPFLAAGVRQVVGSQWQVEDAATRRFFTAFHRRVAREGDAITALRATKLEFLYSGDAILSSPRTWGAFVLVGG